MQNNNASQTGARIRHVPIHIERRNDDTPNNYNNHTFSDNIQHAHQRRYPADHHSQGVYDLSSTLDRGFNQTRRDNLNSNSQFGYATHRPQYQPRENVSSIDLTYKPNSRETKQDPPQPPSRDHSDPTQWRNQQQQQHFQDTELKSPEENLASDKENSCESDGSDLFADTTLDSDGGRAKTRTVIPLPPPPTQQAPSETKSASPVSQSQAESSKKPKKEAGPIGLISDIKQEVAELFQNIVNCNETSLKSKECMRIDELLTRCTLKLDNIESGDVQNIRQKRKAVIEFIDKCSDILQRKVQLNHDIQQLGSET